MKTPKEYKENGFELGELYTIQQIPDFYSIYHNKLVQIVHPTEYKYKGYVDDENTLFFKVLGEGNVDGYDFNTINTYIEFVPFKITPILEKLEWS